MRDKMSVRKGAMTASAAALLWALLSTGTALADEPVEFDLDPAPLGDSLRAFGQQSGVAIMFSEAAVAPLTAPSLKGTYEPEAALAVHGGVDGLWKGASLCPGRWRGGVAGV